MGKNRVEAFTDAVIAIVMTLLVLELHEPDAPTWQALEGIEHKVVVYLISFVCLAIYWNNHHHLFQLVEKIDGRVLWANNFLILMMTLFPFITAWVGDYPFDWAPQAVYGLVILGTNVSYLFLIISLVRSNGENSVFSQAFPNYYKSYFSIGMIVVGLILGYFINPILVLVSNVIVLLFWFIPERKIEEIL